MKNLLTTKMREDNIAVMMGEHTGCSDNMNTDIGCGAKCTDTCDRSCHDFCGDFVMF